MEKAFHSKFRKNKGKFNDKMQQITQKFTEIDTNITLILDNIELDDTKLKVNRLELSNNSNENNEENKKISADAEQFKVFVEKTNKSIVFMDEEIKVLKKITTEERFKNNQTMDRNNGSSSQSNEEKNALEQINELQKNEKYILSNLFTKIEKDELDKATKVLTLEIEKLVKIPLK